VNKLHHGVVKSGKFVPYNVEKLNIEMKCLEGKEISISVFKKKKNRSNPQNRYLWGVVYEIISDFTGYTREESHESMKNMFLKVINDVLPDTIKSTAKLSTDEFETYTENVRRFWANEYGLYIPEPNEVDY
tara:strand:+ start:370 stop:762 length:393 start_codon:yes stop_codon:yes gene_type:complete